MSSKSERPEITLTLSLYLNSKLEQYFPNDPFSDITLIFCTKNYKLQKAYLRLESDYFCESFIEKSNNVAENNQIFIIGKKFEIALFEKILRCFYGGKAIIHLNEIYNAFEICHYLRSNKLVSQMVEQLVQNFANLNFFLVYSIGCMYSNDELLEKCFTFLKETNFKSMMEECVIYASKPNNKYPNTIFALSEVSFRNLIKMHNQFKLYSSRSTGFLDYHEIYNIIRAFVVSNYPKTEQVNKLKDLVCDLIDRNQLNSKEYKIIYHQELFLLDDEMAIKNNEASNYLNNKNETSKYLKTSESSKLDLVASENFLYRKEMEELRSDNALLLEELKILKENFKKSQQNLSQYDEKYNEMVSKFTEAKGDFNNNQIKNELRFYQLETVIDELKTEISSILRQNNERNLFQRTFSEKITSCHDDNNNNNPNFRKSSPLLEKFNRRSTEETKASRTRVDQFPMNSRKKNPTINHYNNDNEIIQNIRMSELAKSSTLEEKPITPTYSTLQKPFEIQKNNIRKEKNIEDLLKKMEDEKKQLEINVLMKSPIFKHPNFEGEKTKNIEELMKNICLEPKPNEELTQESFFFLEKNSNNLNNTMLSNYSQIINPNMLTNQIYQINYKNTVMIDLESELLNKESQFETLKKWFDIKLYQKLKLHLIYKGTRDGFTFASLMEKIQGNNPIMIFFNTEEFPGEIFGGFIGAHSSQGFAFEMVQKVRIDYYIAEKSENNQNNEFFLYFGDVIKIFENCEGHNKNVMKGELRKVEESGEINFTVVELEVFRILIDSEMDF